MSTRRMYRRRFLNRPGHHAGAYAIAEINVLASHGKSKGQVVASLTIADCSRVVELDFYVDNEASAANAVFKARLLREIVDSFAQAQERAVDEWRASSAAVAADG